jgi:hypothetical protein
MEGKCLLFDHVSLNSSQKLCRENENTLSVFDHFFSMIVPFVR